jgi:hypothetical protein
MSVHWERRTIAIGLLCAVLLGGCAASKNPLGPESEAVSEPRLAGSWQYDGDERGEWDYLHVLAGEHTTFQIVAVNSEERAWVVLSGHVTAVGEHRFVNLRILQAPQEIDADVERHGRKDTHPYSFIGYRFEDDGRLVLAYPLEALHAAVMAGRLAGTTDGDYDVFITDEPAAISAVLGGLSDAELFREPIAYRRIAAALPP